MNKKKLTTIYREILTALGFEVDEKGGVYFEALGVRAPFTMNKRQLVIPTDEWLKNPDWENTIPFHPLSENTQRKKSEVLERLTLCVCNRLYQVGATMICFLTELAADTDRHAKLTPEQRDYLRLLPEADKRTVEDTRKLMMSKLTFKGDNAFINIFIKRGGVWKGEEYSRVAVTTFPIADQENNEDKKIFDVTFRVRDRAALFNLLRHIFPNFDKSIDEYSYGSRSSVAPNFHSLMMAFANLAFDLNKVTKVFQEDFEEMKGLLIGTNWVKNMAELTEYRNDIPPLEGNEGEANEDELAKPKAKAENRERIREEREQRREVSSGRRQVLRSTDERRDEPRSLIGGSRNDRRYDDDRRGGGLLRRVSHDDRDDRDYDDDRRGSRPRSLLDRYDDRDYDRRGSGFGERSAFGSRNRFRR
nr:MAG TPA: hypothetical protein [Bacteriophage sp.]